MKETHAQWRLCHGGVENSEDIIAKSLEGDYRPEHLFALRQSLAAFRYYQQLVLEADRELANYLGGFETAATAEVEPPQRTKHSHYQRRRYEPKSFDLRAELYRIFGVDLTNVPGGSAIRARPSCVRSARRYRSSGMPPHLHPGGACAPRRKSAEARS